MRTGNPELDYIDFYDHDALEKLHEKRAKMWMKLYLKASKGNPKAIEAIEKHEAEDRILREQAKETWYYWT